MARMRRLGRVVNASPDKARLVDSISRPRKWGRPQSARSCGYRHAAIELYHRLGFRRIEGDQIQHVMECRPQP